MTAAIRPTSETHSWQTLELGHVLSELLVLPLNLIQAPSPIQESGNVCKVVPLESRLELGLVKRTKADVARSIGLVSPLDEAMTDLLSHVAIDLGLKHRVLVCRVS